MKQGLSYGDVALVPKYNNVSSRTIPSTDTWLTNTVKMGVPILASNMDTIIGIDLAKVLVSKGSIPIFHRFYKNTEDLIKLVKQFPGKCFMSCGVNNLKDVFNTIKNNRLEPLGLCIDIAHGWSLGVLNAINEIKEFSEGLEIIAGNICSKDAYRDLVNSGVDAVKVGIGPGSVCSTRKITAYGVPQFTAVKECGKVALEMKCPMIADGGIRSSRELILALAAGASSVMIGGMFARTYEAAGKGEFRGQASEAFQKDYFGNVKAGTIPEGINKKVEQNIRANDLIDELLAGLKSGMTYGGAKDLKEFQRKAEFIRITENYWG